MAKVKSATSSTPVSQFSPLNNDYASPAIVTNSATGRGGGGTGGGCTDNKKRCGDKNACGAAILESNNKRSFSSNIILTANSSKSSDHIANTNNCNNNYRNCNNWSCNNLNTAHNRKEPVNPERKGNQDLFIKAETVASNTVVTPACAQNPCKSYLLGRQQSTDKLILSPLSPSAYTRSPKIRFRCPSVDLIVSPSTASAYSSEDCAEISVDSWEDDSPLDDEYSLLFGDKNEFPLSYSKMEESSTELHENLHDLKETHMEDTETVKAIKKPMNGHVPHDDNVDAEEHHSAASSRRSSSNVEEKSHVTSSQPGSRRASSNAGDGHHSVSDSRRSSKTEKEETVREETHENVAEDETPVESYDAIGEGNEEAEENQKQVKNEENDQVADETADEENKPINEEDVDGEQSRKSSVVSAHSAVSEKAAEHADDHSEAAVAATEDEPVQEEQRRESIGSNSETQREEPEDHVQPNDEEALVNEENEASNETVIEEHMESVEVREEEEMPVAEEHEEIAEVQENDAGHQPATGEVVEEAVVEDTNEGQTEETEQNEEVVNEVILESLNEEAPVAEAVENQPTSTTATPKRIRKEKVGGSPRKTNLSTTSPRHVGGPPLRGRLRGTPRTQVPPPAAPAESKLNRSWNMGVRRTQSQSPGRTTVDDMAMKMARQIDLHSIFGRTDSAMEKRKHKEEALQRKKAEEEEKLHAEKEQRRKEAEGAFQAWLHRKAQERRRARSTGRSSTESEVAQENNTEEKQRNRAEAEAAFQAWLERKKDEQKERKRQLLTASKSQQHVSSSEDSNEAFRQWKEQKNQQRREERKLIKAQMLEMQTVIPIGYSDSIRSIRQIRYNNVHLQNGLPKLNHFRTISPANKKRVPRSDSLPSINSSPDGAVKVT